jgi:hypothetical protein
MGFQMHVYHTQIIFRCDRHLKTHVHVHRYYLDGQVNKNEMDSYVACRGDGSGAYWVLVGKPEGERSLGRPRHTWEDNLKMDQELGWESVEWIDLAQDRDMW